MEPRTQIKFEPGVIEASQSVLAELGVTLRSYSQDLVLIGGWVPYFLLKEHQKEGFDHVGSIDIDIAVHPRISERGGYASIAKLIEKRGYKPPEDDLSDVFEFRYDRKIVSPYDQKSYAIRVDFLTTEAGDPKKEHRHREVQPGLRAFKAKGAELAFENPFEIELKAKLPDSGGEAKVKWQVANIAASLVTKGLALGGRYKEKDAYDIFYLVRYYKKGPESMAEALRPYLQLEVVKESLKNIRDAFRDIRSNGPAWVANFKDIHDLRPREILIADVFKTFERFWKQLG